MTTITLPIAGITSPLRRAAAWWHHRRESRPRTARVTAILCPACRTWRTPRHFTRTAATCRTCTPTQRRWSRTPITAPCSNGDPE